MSLPAISALCLVLFVVFRLTHNFYKAQVWLMIIAGLSLGGTLARLVTRLTNSLMHGSNVLEAQFTGAAVTFLLAAGLAAYLWLGALKKGAQPNRFDPYIALFLFTIFVATGGAWADAAHKGQDIVTSASQEISQTFSDFFAEL
jgi:phosphatidylglycerophosphate synthase